MNYGKKNISTGLLVLATFMAYGFGLIYMRDFAPDKVEWIANSHTGTHFEARLAHVHGNLFALLNIILGYLLLNLNIREIAKKWISILLLVAFLMPLGIVAEFTLGVPPIFVLIGAISAVTAVAWFGIEVYKSDKK
ncbi:MAG TPA: hypothetical protein EYG92_10885 [Lutibacter sp.]|nr:hypothetical protein [Lutibacter sp.]